MTSTKPSDAAVKRPAPTMLGHLFGRLIADRRPVAPSEQAIDDRRLAA